MRVASRDVAKTVAIVTGAVLVGGLVPLATPFGEQVLAAIGLSSWDVLRLRVVVIATVTGVGSNLLVRVAREWWLLVGVVVGLSPIVVPYATVAASHTLPWSTVNWVLVVESLAVVIVSVAAAWLGGQRPVAGRPDSSTAADDVRGGA